MIELNGKMCSADGEKLADFLLESGYNIRRVTVEYNGKILQLSEYDRQLKDGDRLTVSAYSCVCQGE